MVWELEMGISTHDGRRTTLLSKMGGRGTPSSGTGANARRNASVKEKQRRSDAERVSAAGKKHKGHDTVFQDLKGHVDEGLEIRCLSQGQQPSRENGVSFRGMARYLCLIR